MLCAMRTAGNQNVDTVSAHTTPEEAWQRGCVRDIKGLRKTKTCCRLQLAFRLRAVISRT